MCNSLALLLLKSVAHLSLSLVSSLAVTMTSIPMFRFGQNVFLPPFPDETTARTPGMDNVFYIEINSGIGRDFYSVDGPPDSTGGIRFFLADEVSESMHKTTCGCYWCLRWSWLNLYYMRPDNTPPEPRQPDRYARRALRSGYKSSDPPSPALPYLEALWPAWILLQP